MNPVVKAAFWMLGAVASFSSMAIAGRLLSAEHDTFEIMLFRSIVGVVVMAIVLTLRGRWRDIRRDHVGLHLVRNLSHFTGQNLWFFAVGVAPLAQVFALEFTAPLWVLLLSPIFLGERITRVQAVAATIGFAGILVLTQPFSTSLSPGVLAAAGAAIGFAGSAVFTRRLTRTETLGAILFYLTAMQVVFGFVMAGYDGDIALPSAATLPYLVLIGFAGLFAHYCLTSALKLAPASLVMPVDFLRLPVIALLGFVLFQEELTWPLVVGAVFILSANWMNLRAGFRASRMIA